MTENHISSLTYNNNTDIDFAELNMFNDNFGQLITHRDEEQKENESKKENDEEQKTPLEYLTSLEELNDIIENEEINIYNVGVYPLQDYWDSTDLYVDIVDKSSLKGFQKKIKKNTIANEEMNLFLYHHQKNKKENDIIYTGSSLGKIRKYGLSEQKYMLNLENSKKFESPVLCFDVKQNMKSNTITLIAGFENGYIVVYEEDKEVDRNKDMFKNTPIISIKIIKITDKINEIVDDFNPIYNELGNLSSKIDSVDDKLNQHISQESTFEEETDARLDSLENKIDKKLDEREAYDTFAKKSDVYTKQEVDDKIEHIGDEYATEEWLFV